MATATYVPNSLQYYLDKIPYPHNTKPKFMATVAAEVQPFVDLQATLAQIFNGLFNVNTATGNALDMVGARVGVTRFLPQPVNGSSELGDSDFRTLIQAVIATNNWDGTVPGIYTIWNSVFNGTLQVLVQDNQDMTMFIVLVASTFSNVALALLVDGYFDLCPAGVELLGYFQPSAAGQPVFGLGIESAQIAGLGVGYIVQEITT